MSYEADEDGELDCRYTPLSNPEDVRTLVTAICGARRSTSRCCRRTTTTQPVTALYLHGCGITAGGAEVLAQFLASAGASALTHLSLSENPLGDAGVAVLLQKGLMKNKTLEYVSLRSKLQCTGPPANYSKWCGPEHPWERER